SAYFYRCPPPARGSSVSHIGPSENRGPAEGPAGPGPNPSIDPAPGVAQPSSTAAPHPPDGRACRILVLLKIEDPLRVPLALAPIREFAPSVTGQVLVGLRGSKKHSTAAMAHFWRR